VRNIGAYARSLLPKRWHSVENQSGNTSVKLSVVCEDSLGRRFVVRLSPKSSVLDDGSLLVVVRLRDVLHLLVNRVLEK